MKNITKVLAVFGLLLAVFAFSGSVLAREGVSDSYQFLNNLSMGSSGEDVALLQTKLIELGFKIPAIENGSIPKGYFGGQTLSAVIHYQQSLGLPGTGFVGPLTRGSLNSKKDNSQSFLVSVDGPSNLLVGEVGTWKINVKDQTQSTGNLSYSVNWSDAIALPANSSNSSSGVVPAVVQTSTFTHSYTYASKYNANFMVFENGKLKGSVNLSINVTDPNKVDIKVSSPNGGENWPAGSERVITWNVNNENSSNLKFDIYLEITNPCTLPGSACLSPLPYYRSSFVLDKNISASANAKYNWIVGTDIDNKDIPPADNYIIKICEASTSNCDYSDHPFSISSPGTESLKIKVTSPKGGEKWSAKSAETIAWNVLSNSAPNSKVDIYLEKYRDNSVVNCKLSLVPCAQGTPVQYVLDRKISASDLKYDWIVATDIDNKEIPNGDYLVKICESNSKENCYQSSESFTITSALKERNNAPVVTGITGPITLKVGEEGSWTINAYDTEREDLSYDIYAYSTKTGSVTGIYTSGAGSSNIWKTRFSSKGEYTTIITVSDKVGNVTKVSITVNVL